jgi:hypothetical protein
MLIQFRPEVKLAKDVCIRYISKAYGVEFANYPEAITNKKRGALLNNQVRAGCLAFLMHTAIISAA